MKPLTLDETTAAIQLVIQSLCLNRLLDLMKPILASGQDTFLLNVESYVESAFLAA